MGQYTEASYSQRQDTSHVLRRWKTLKIRSTRTSQRTAFWGKRGCQSGGSCNGKGASAVIALDAEGKGEKLEIDSEAAFLGLAL